MTIPGRAFEFNETSKLRSCAKFVFVILHSRSNREYKPEVAHLVDWGYNAIDPHRPTIQNYIDEARKHGLVIEGVKRIYDNLRYDLVSNGKIIYKNSSPNPKKKILPKIDIDEVLKNIHQFRTDVKLEDLLTRAAVMVFRKI